jgi:hypothetical protein
VLGYNDEVGCFAMRLAVSLSLRASRAPPRRLIKVRGVGVTVVSERIQYGVLDYVLYNVVYYKVTRHGPVSGSAISSCILYRHGLSSN